MWDFIEFLLFAIVMSFSVAMLMSFWIFRTEDKREEKIQEATDEWVNSIKALLEYGEDVEFYIDFSKFPGMCRERQIKLNYDLLKLYVKMKYGEDIE